MGMYVSFVRVTPQQLEQAIKDLEWSEEYLESLYEDGAEPLPDDAEADLEKSWDALDHLFSAAGVRFSIQEDGDCVASGDGWYHNGWSVEEVTAAAKVLKETSFDALTAHCDAAALSKDEVYPMRHMWDAGDVESLRFAFDSLRTFFLAAAKSGHGALMSFG